MKNLKKLFLICTSLSIFACATNNIKRGHGDDTSNIAYDKFSNGNNPKQKNKIFNNLQSFKTKISKFKKNNKTKETKKSFNDYKNLNNIKVSNLNKKDDNIVTVDFKNKENDNVLLDSKQSNLTNKNKTVKNGNKDFDYSKLNDKKNDTIKSKIKFYISKISNKIKRNNKDLKTPLPVDFEEKVKRYQKRIIQQLEDEYGIDKYNYNVIYKKKNDLKLDKVLIKNNDNNKIFRRISIKIDINRQYEIICNEDKITELNKKINNISSSKEPKEKIDNLKKLRKEAFINLLKHHIEENYNLYFSIEYKNKIFAFGKYLEGENFIERKFEILKNEKYREIIEDHRDEIIESIKNIKRKIHLKFWGTQTGLMAGQAVNLALDGLTGGIWLPFHAVYTILHGLKSGSATADYLDILMEYQKYIKLLNSKSLVTKK